jgi:hypothetical protein
LNRFWLSGVYLVKPCRHLLRHSTLLEHDPEKCAAVFGKDHAQTESCILMLERMVFALLAVILLALPLQAKDCPVETRVEGTLEAKEEAIRKAPSCKEALAIMEACAYGAGGDTGLGEAVRERCESEFLPKLSKAQRKDYDRGIRRCNGKYRNESGTMYRSFEAFCRAQLTVRTAEKLAKAKR